MNLMGAVGMSRGTSSSDSAVGCIGVALGLALVIFLLMWPIWLGDKVGSLLTGHSPSGPGTFTGWLLEGLWISLLLGLLVDRGLQTSEQRKADEDEQRKAREQQVQEELAAQTQAVGVTIQQLIDLYRRVETTIRREEPGGVLLRLAPLDLLEPPATYANGPRIPRSIDRGQVEISPSAVIFTSTTKRVEWKLRNLIQMSLGADAAMFEVTNRKTISGFSFPPDSRPLVNVAIETARRMHDGTMRFSDFEAAVTTAHGQLEQRLHQLRPSLPVQR